MGAENNKPPRWGPYATLAIVFGFMGVLMSRGVDVQSALYGAGAGGVIAVGLTRRFDSGPSDQGPQTSDDDPPSLPGPHTSSED